MKPETKLIRIEGKIANLIKEASLIRTELFKNRQEKRCKYMWNTNTPCLLEKDHKGAHRVPCAIRTSHVGHHEIDGIEEIVCSGFSFDRT